MQNTERNNLNKLIHVINEVRNTKLCWAAHGIEEYRSIASNAIADELQAEADKIESDKYSMNRAEIKLALADYKSIDVENSAAFHAQVLLDSVYDAIRQVAWNNRAWDKNNGLPTNDDWAAAAKMVNMRTLAHDAIHHWKSQLHCAPYAPKHPTKQLHVRPDTDIVEYVSKKPRGWLSKLVNDAIRADMKESR